MPIDRAAVYQRALPSYTDDIRTPLAVKTVESHAITGARLLRFSYLGANGQRVPALLFMPLRASVTHPAPCLVLLHGLGGSKETMAGLALFAAKSGYASLVIDEYGQGERTPTEPSAQSQAEQLATAVHQSVLDIRRGLDYLGHCAISASSGSAWSAFHWERSSGQWQRAWSRESRQRP